MKNISVHLHQFIVESLHPKEFVGKRISSNEFEKWNKYVLKEIDKLSLEISDPILKNRRTRDFFIAGIYMQIAELSNVINGYLTRHSRIWQKHHDAYNIRFNFLRTCSILDGFLDRLSQKFPDAVGKLPFPDNAFYQIKSELKAQLNQVIKHFGSSYIGDDLIAVINESIGHLINRKQLSRQDSQYLKRLMFDLVKRKFDSPEKLVDYLIINDFNLPEFFLFCVDGWSAKFANLDGLEDQREALLEVKSHLFDISLTKGLKYPSIDHRLYTELNNFLTEKYAVVKERLKISLQTAEAAIKPRSKKVLINLSVAQLGLFIRMLVEKGILAKEHIGELFSFFAKHFYTPNTDLISAESLQKKSSDVEHATAVKLKAHLIAMLNWLNTNYNLSNYN